MSASPASSSKRIKLELSPSPRLTDLDNPTTSDDEHLDYDHCVICLQSYTDRTVIPTCSHEFCFECISLWAEQSQKCPLCSQLIGEYLIHRIRSQFDYQKHYLPPPRSKSPQLLPTGETRVRAARRARRERYWGRRNRDADEADELERAIAKRRWVYQNHFYAKHVASNSFTRYRPYPTPAQFAASPDMISRATIFLRRELRVWPNLDVEFLTTFTISLLKSIDIRAESAVKLLAEFLDLDTPYIEGQRHPNAEHFAHEIYSYIRSGRDLSTYDNLVQYDTSEFPLPYEEERSNKWRHEYRSRSPHHRRHRSRSRSHSPLSRPTSSSLHAEYGRTPSTVRRRDSSDDFPDLVLRKRSRSVVSKRRDIFDTSNNHRRQPDGIQQQSVDKSEKAKGKERERDRTTPLLGGNEHHSSVPHNASGESLPDSVVVPQRTAESHTFGCSILGTHKESDLEHAFVPTASGEAIFVLHGDNADAKSAASGSRKRPGVLGRPPRTLLESVHAHLSKNTASKQSKRRTDTSETDTTPNHLLRLSRRRRDADDGGNNVPALLSRLSSPPTRIPHTSPPYSHPPSPNVTTPLLGKNREGNQNLPTDPVTKSTAEEMASRNTMVRSCNDTYTLNDGDNNERISASSPPPFADPGESARRSCQKPNANSNFISSPHSSDLDCMEIQRAHPELGAATYGIKNKAVVRPSSDMRTVLLQRLEAEQRVARKDALALDDSASPAQDVVATQPGGEEAEARLRARVLPRVHLAAIKNAPQMNA